MSTNPFPNGSQPQYYTLSPEWSALLKIGRAYRLLFQFYLIWILLIVGFGVTMTAIVVTNFDELEKAFHEAQAVVEEELREVTVEEMEFGLEPEPALEFQSTELANPTEESEGSHPVFDEEKLWEYLEKTPLMMVLVLFFFVFLLMVLIQFVIQIIVLLRFAKCPDSIVLGGHTTGVAYAVCMGLALLLGPFVPPLTGPLNLAAFIVFLVFSYKIAAAVQSRNGRRWLTILIVAMVSLFLTLFVGGFLAIALALSEIPELIIGGFLTLALVFALESFMVWFSFLKIYQHLGRDVPLFIQTVMERYSGQMNEQ